MLTIEQIESVAAETIRGIAPERRALCRTSQQVDATRRNDGTNSTVTVALHHR